MKKSTIAILIAILSVGAIASIYLFQKDEPATSDLPAITSPSTSTPDRATTESAPASSYTAAQVAEHAKVDDCWTIVNGNVYDITAYIPRHPGGQDEILEACGTDGTSLFTQRRTAGGDNVGSGTPHSSNAASQLESLKIGTLAN
jgi:hypothetical protein